MKTTNFSTVRISVLFLAILLIGSNLFAQKKGQYDALVGSWEGSGDYQGQVFYFTFTFAAENDSLKGSWAMDFGTFSIEELEYKKIEDSENYSLTGTIEMDMGGQYISLYLSGEIEKEELSGTLDSEMGNTPFTATKNKPKKEGGMLRLHY